MWIPKSAALIRGWCFFEVRHLLEEIRYIHIYRYIILYNCIYIYIYLYNIYIYVEFNDIGKLFDSLISNRTNTYQEVKRGRMKDQVF